MIYGYIRVSSTTQNIDRQLEEIKKYVSDVKSIFVDKQSGKDFNRVSYKKMFRKLKKGDLLIIKSIDRLGRNYVEIGEQWKEITKVKGCDVFVLDMPILDTRVKPDNLIGTFVADLVLQLLSFIAENERNNIKQRQAEGIRIAKEKGVKFGRPSFKIDEEFLDVVKTYQNNELTLKQVLRKLDISRTTFYKYMKRIGI